MVDCMTDEKLGALLECFAHYYWSAPLVFVVNKIAEWHPDVDAKQMGRVISKCNESLFWHHCCVVDDVVDEPELVTEHLVAFGGDDYDHFIAARIDGPFYECSENELLMVDSGRLDIPEGRAVFEFGKAELNLDDEWAQQLVDDCVLTQPYSLCNGTSWVMEVLRQEKFGKIQFRTIEQVERFRDLGNRFYQVLPNPVFRGWKPEDIENAPVLLDDIPEKDEDIPNARPMMDEFFAKIGGREKALQLLMERVGATPTKKRKIGRNELCPCGSGKKYKKCCGR